MKLGNLEIGDIEKGLRSLTSESLLALQDNWGSKAASYRTFAAEAEPWREDFIKEQKAFSEGYEEMVKLVEVELNGRRSQT